MTEHLDESPGRLLPVVSWRAEVTLGTDCSMCKFVALGLSLWMNEAGGSAFPSVNTIARRLSLSPRTVRHHLNDHLHKQGWLRLVERGGRPGDRRKANEWQATTPAGDAGVSPGPRQEDPPPRHLSALTPAGDAAQVVQELDQELHARAVVCSACGQSFAGLDGDGGLYVHLDACEALAVDDFDLVDARAALRTAGGRGAT